ncbi:transcription antitermination factor NusB [bacterium TMED181]|nr:transcription antitermination factor NusB [Planctomycetota bacterium]OUW44768.1 MAG: transcription antitermination factor NusB [bacterium TMED181]
MSHSTGPRRRARELALQCLYQWDQQGHESSRELAEETLNELGALPESREFALTLVETYWQYSFEIDEWVDAASDRWKLNRMAVIDRNTLRIAATELKYLDDIPPKVAIDEALEIVKRFSTEKSASFVNGILDRLLREIQTSSGEQS